MVQVSCGDRVRRNVRNIMNYSDRKETFTQVRIVLPSCMPHEMACWLRLVELLFQGQRSRMFAQYYTLRLGRTQPVYCADSQRRRGLSSFFKRSREESLWSQFRRQTGSSGAQSDDAQRSRFAQPPNAVEGDFSPEHQIISLHIAYFRPAKSNANSTEGYLLVSNS